MSGKPEATGVNCGEGTPGKCCPPFDPAPWDGKEFNWPDRLFVKDRIRSFLHIPMNFQGVMVRNMARITAAKAETAEPLILVDENSLWGADIHIAVSREVPGAENVKIPGTWLCKVFEGPYKNAGKWAAEMPDYLKSRGKKMGRLLFFYTTCPVCAKRHGKNYVALFGEVI